MLVRITGIPHGEAPEWVRKEWVGLLIEGLSTRQRDAFEEAIGLKDNTPSVGILSRNTIPLDDLSDKDLETDARIAIERLRDKSPEAARWWDENYSTEAIPLFRFNMECFEIMQE